MNRLKRCLLALALVFATALAAAPANASAVADFATLVGESAAAPASIIVGYEPADEARAINSALSLNATQPRRSKSGRFSVLHLPEGADAKAVARRLAAMPGVRYAEPNYLFTALETPTDPDFDLQWGMSRIHAPAAWDITRGSGVVVAIVDSGVDLDHPELASCLDTTNDYDFVNNDSTAEDDEGHGTHVAGIVAAAMNNATGVHGVVGVANQCTILPVKVISSAGESTAAQLADGIIWAADKGADVINLSLGSPSYSQTLNDAIQYAISKDVVIVAASGNNSSYGVLYPARLDNVIGVGSTTSADERSTFSNYGPEIDVCAPGTGIVSTYLSGSYAYASGTSMAAPHAAGVVALIRAVHPEWTRTQVEAQLTATAEDLGAAGRDNYFGYGLVQADRAVGEPMLPTGVLAGRVTDSKGADLPGVSVELAGYSPVLTGTDGRYTINGIAPGTYRVTFSKSGYVSQTRSAAMTCDETTTVDATLPSATYETVYRFYNTVNGSHFYTASAEERDVVLARWPEVYTLDGVAYVINVSNPANSSPLYRFYNTKNGSHFYTASAEERDIVIARWPDTYSYDGPAYNVCATAVAGATPVYRFYNKRNGSHFYTASAEEFEIVVMRWPDVYALDGQAFWIAP